MNRIVLLTLALAATGASAAALAQAAPGADGKRDHHRGRHGHDIVQLDADQDGRIARAELAGDSRRGKWLATQFDAIDANRDGYLVRTELQAWREAHRAERMQQRGERHGQRFAEADLNRDGKLSKVEVSEKLPRMADRFAWLDDNRDGYLSREEMRPLHRGR
jgi:Ca2+-binding EF-hand superfamily protein